MLLYICVVLVVIGANTAQDLGAICHSNTMQHTEDEVITKIVQAMNTDFDSVITRKEVLIFFAELMGIQLGSLIDIVANLSNEQLLMAAAGLSIEKESFAQAWHARFHDNLDFVYATFDRFDVNKDGLMNALEIEAIVNKALIHGDQNHDGKLETNELVSYLETIYKHCRGHGN
ncbi:uncharacterized protein [Littorina saxatilis]|uniref:EF-hand domain-containing protein n=1 Tax=Littorina saxatilis TaxID=31220 RepID=A0AAN9FVS9_9CAEN